MKRIEIPIRDAFLEAPAPAGVGAQTTTATSVTIPLPTWTDSTSVATFATAAIGIANTVITLVHPGYHEPAIVEALVAPVSILVAAGAMIANIIRHSKATIAAIAR